MQPLHYYNDTDPFIAAWLRALIAKGLIPDGDVDVRSIRDVRPVDLIGYTQCHFFAGIGGWPLALRLAGWPEDREVWTGSCPCQPYSTAGKQKGAADERDLWPVWFSLIKKFRPPTVFGEQVANAIKHGWLDRAADDMEATEYAFASAVLPACGVGAPHKRDRVWFVADVNDQREHARALDAEVARAPPACPHTDRERLPIPRPLALRANGEQSGRASAAGNWWATQPGVGCVAHGVPNRVGALRGFGNSIVPQVAAEFIAACCEAL